MHRKLLGVLLLLAAACGGGGGGTVVVVVPTLDLLTAVVLRVHGSVGDGGLGVPVCGGADCDGDGTLDVAFAAFRANPLARGGAGEVFLVFGAGSVTGVRDTAGVQPRILRIFGDEVLEAAGNEVWMDDVTGDGIGDLLIGRQNHAGGMGALTIVVGGPALAQLAAAGDPLDLRNPDPSVTLRTIVGTQAVGRLGIWMRTGDVTGDGTADIVVGADQEDGGQGAAYVIRGGGYLATGGSFDGNLVRIFVPVGSVEFHFGATCQLADLDGNGRCEVLVAATIERGGASIPPDGAPPGSARALGGADRGRLYIAWDDNFADPWPVGFNFDITQSPGARTIISGGVRNVRFGEEILGGLDYDRDGRADMFVGDITGDGTGTRSRSGVGYVFYGAADLRGLEFGMDAPPPGAVFTTIYGADRGDISSDTAAHGDFDNDGAADLAVASPHGSPLGRNDAGTIHVFFGGTRWPAIIDLRAPSAVRYTRILGGNGGGIGDRGDVLGYSAAAADLNGDGRIDLIANEMLGNGILPAAIDTGNLIVISGATLADPPD